MEALLTRIVDGGDDVFYRHEQKGDAALTVVEKREILSRLFVESPPVFLQRYFKWIDKSDASLFDRFENPLVAYFLDKLERPPPSEAHKRNRRFNALEKLKKEGVFFSDVKMQEREPQLYERMVGRYLDDDERLHVRPTITPTEANGWAGMLSRLEDRVDDMMQQRAATGEWEGGEGSANVIEQDASDRFLSHVGNRFEMEEEEEEEERREKEDGPGMSEMRKEMDGIKKKMDEEDEQRFEEENEEEEDEDDAMEEDVPMETLREEFISFMYERFLSGKDTAFFDYSAIDRDDDADDYDDPIAERDREEAWFDED